MPTAIVLAEDYKTGHDGQTIDISLFYLRSTWLTPGTADITIDKFECVVQDFNFEANGEFIDAKTFCNRVRRRVLGDDDWSVDMTGLNGDEAPQLVRAYFLAKAASSKGPWSITTVDFGTDVMTIPGVVTGSGFRMPVELHEQTFKVQADGKLPTFA